MRLASVLKFRLLQAEVLNYPGSEQQRCWSDCADAQADLRFCCLHMAKTSFLMTWLFWFSFKFNTRHFFLATNSWNPSCWARVVQVLFNSILWQTFSAIVIWLISKLFRLFHKPNIRWGQAGASKTYKIMCAKQRFRSAWTSVQCDQSSLCPLRTLSFYMRTENSDHWVIVHADLCFLLGAHCLAGFGILGHNLNAKLS